MFVSLSGRLEKANRHTATERLEAPLARGVMTEVNRLQRNILGSKEIQTWRHTSILTCPRQQAH